MRKLAHIEKIEWKRPIEGADKIELVGVLGWQCIAKKDEFNVGDLCVYIEIDSIVDSKNPDFAFLEPKKYRIKTMKMRGVLSQGIVFPTTILHDAVERQIGDDVTATLKIREAEDDIPTVSRETQSTALKQSHKKLFRNKVFLWFMKFQWFRNIILKLLIPKKKPRFPSWIVKTDETRLQNMPHVLEACADKPMVVTEKLDGTSTTFGVKKTGRNKNKYEFVVCSRNLIQSQKSGQGIDDSNIYFQIAGRYKMQDVLTQLAKRFKATTLVIQGETIGEGIQGNKYSLKGIDFYAFNLIIDGKRIDSPTAAAIVKEFDIKWVPVLQTDFKLLPTVNEMLAYADGQSTIANTLREGLVIRDHDNSVSFKCISNQFLLKHHL